MSTSPIGFSSPSNPAAIYSTPAASKAKANANAAATTTSTANDGLTGTTTGTTFLSLLVKELQNQDPSAPMDSTAMVGQMISLNQLDQLISINQVLSSAKSASATPYLTGATGSAGSPSTSSAALMAQRTDLQNSLSTQTQTQAALAAANDPNSTLNFSTMNIPFGGK